MSTTVKPFLLLDYDHDQAEIGKLIYGLAVISNRISVDKQEVAAKFRDCLSKLSQQLGECEKDRDRLARKMLQNTDRTQEDLDQMWEHKEKLARHVDLGEAFHTRVQGLLSVCEQAMRIVPLNEYGTYTQEAWDTLMKAFLSDQMEVTQSLIEDMSTWVRTYEGFANDFQIE